MTKLVRIENADTSNHVVRVRTERLTVDGGAWADDPSMARTIERPTDMVEGYVRKRQRIVVEEV